MRPARKSRERGLFKKCDHLWDGCKCPWLGRALHIRRVNLATWAGVGKRNLTRTEAINILADVRAAVLKGEFDPAGKARDPKGTTVGTLLDDYAADIEKRGLTGSAVGPFIKGVREEFGSMTVALVADSPARIEQWMERMADREVPLSHTTTKTRRVVWTPRTWNSYRAMGIRLFNWARHPKRRITTGNPFLLIEPRKGERHRETRITEDEQRRLFEVCEQWKVATRKGSTTANKKLQRAGREMYRRLCAAFDTGVRAGEMLQIQIKHVDFVNWRITLPWGNAKGGKVTGRDEYVWVMSDRLRKVFEERRFLGDNAYVFGTDEGQKVEKFAKTWRALFRAAGLSDDLIWHDLRHEFVSSLIEEGGNIQEVKEAARHKSITTTAKYMKAQDDRVRALLERRANRISTL
jgi:integrase